MFERDPMEKVFTGEWYPWYPEKALTSEAIDGLSMAEEGAYRRALDKAWIKGSIPSDPKEAARVIGKGCTPKMASRILALFTPVRGNKKRSVNLPQERIRAEQKEKHEKAVNRAENAANKRWAEANKNGGANATSTPQALLKDAIKNKSIEEEKEEEKEKERREETPQAAATAATKKPQATDDEWLDSLQSNPAYQFLEVRKEFARAMVWTETNNRQCTRRFFVNWLNRAKPMTAEITTNGTSKQPTTFRAQRKAEKQRESEFYDELERGIAARQAELLSRGGPDSATVLHARGAGPKRLGSG